MYSIQVLRITTPNLLQSRRFEKEEAVCHTWLACYVVRMLDSSMYVYIYYMMYMIYVYIHVMLHLHAAGQIYDLTDARFV